MTYSCVVVSVKDIKKARKFYEEVFGLKIEYDFGRNIAFDCGIALQEDFDWLTNIDKKDIKTKANNFEMCFEEEEFDDFVKKIKNYPNIRIIHDVIKYDWGQRVIRFYDLDEHIIEVGESFKSVIKSFLKEGLSYEQIAEKIDGTVDEVHQLLK